MPSDVFLKGRLMTLTRVILLGVCVASSSAIADEKFKLPPEITPAIRAACEDNVRALCVTPTSTQSSIVSCVRRNFINLNRNCRNELTSAGLM
jgi:hypothetical protein